MKLRPGLYGYWKLEYECTQRNENNTGKETVKVSTKFLGSITQIVHLEDAVFVQFEGSRRYKLKEIVGFTPVIINDITAEV